MEESLRVVVCRACGAVLTARDKGRTELCLDCLLEPALDPQVLAAPADETPSLFAHYEIAAEPDGSLVELGRGAMGITYRAVDHTLHCAVALKVINRDLARHPGARERFLREARSAAGLRHPHVASVFFFGERPGDRQLFYAMELIEGETLEARVRRVGGLSTDVVLKIGAQVAEALAAAEARGLTHRDLKPANVMLVTGDTLDAKVIDFGLAKAAAGTASAGLTAEEGFVGTPSFASPEQFDGGQSIDARSDFYALGATLWFALTARAPFGGRTLAEIHDRQINHPLPLDQLRAARVPPPVVNLLRTLLSPAPADRPQNSRDLAAAFARCRDVIASRPTKTVRRISVSVLLFAIIGVLGLVTMLHRRTDDIARQNHQLQQQTFAQQQQLAGLQNQLEQQTRLIALVNAKIDHDTSSTGNGPVRADPAPVAQSEVARERDISVDKLRRLLESEKVDVRQLLAQLDQSNPAVARTEPWRRLKRDALARLGQGESAAGRYAAAIDPYQRALALVDAAQDPLAWCDAAQNLELALRQAGRYSDAAPLAQEVVDRRSALQGSEHPATLAALHEQGFLLLSQGDLAGSETLYRRALEAQERTLGKESPDALSTATDLCNLLAERGKYAESEALGRRTLEARERILGKENPATLTSLSNLAITLQEEAKTAEADALCRRCLEGRERVLGPEHPDTMRSVNNLAVLLDDRGDVAGAEALYRRVLAFDERTLGSEHPETLGDLNNLALTLEHRNDYAAAEPLLRRCVEVGERVQGKDHPNTLIYVDSLAGLLSNKSDKSGLSEAEVLFRRCVEAKERTLGKEHPATLRSLSNLAQLLDDEGKTADAEVLYEQAAAAMARVLLPQDLIRMDLEHFFSLLREKQGRLAEAVLLAQQAADGSQTLPKDNALRHTYEQHLQELQSKDAAATLRSPAPVK